MPIALRSSVSNCRIRSDAAGVERIRLEWLRHTGASVAYAATKDMRAVADRLGHTSTRMMDTVYVQLYADSTRKVADAIDVWVERDRSMT